MKKNQVLVLSMLKAVSNTLMKVLTDHFRNIWGKNITPDEPQELVRHRSALNSILHFLQDSFWQTGCSHWPLAQTETDSIQKMRRMLRLGFCSWKNYRAVHLMCHSFIHMDINHAMKMIFPLTCNWSVCMKPCVCLFFISLVALQVHSAYLRPD